MKDASPEGFLPDHFPPSLPIRILRNIGAVLFTGGAVIAMSTLIDILFSIGRYVPTDGRPIMYGIGLMIAAIILYAVAFVVNGGDLEGVQKKRDKEAREIADRAIAGKTTAPYALYLRPFSSTGHLRVRQRQSLLLLQEPSLGGGAPRTYSFELESTITWVVWGWAPMIALGKPGEHFGSGRLPVDESKWEEVAANLIREANSVFVVPGSSSGMMWELRHLRDAGCWQKTVMLMPPSAGNTDYPEVWKETAAAIVSLGYDLPPYNRRGAAFRLTNEGRAEKLVLFPKRWSLRAFRRSLESLRGFANCEVPLVEDSPAEETVLETSDPALLAVAESLLLEGEIPYRKKGEQIQSLLAVGPVLLQVPKEYAEAALEILEALKQVAEGQQDSPSIEELHGRTPPIERTEPSASRPGAPLI